MKKKWCRLTALALCLVLCLPLVGCGEDTDPTDASTKPSHTPVDPTQVTGNINQEGLHTKPGEEDGQTVAFTAAGSRKITFTVATSSVRYVTSVSQLPDYEELKKYDEAYFETGALLLITESVNSGSVDVGIQSITVEDGMASVVLSHTAMGDMTTPVMSTWVIWAEVEQGLEYHWSVENPAMKSETQTS